jgi:hypothetical protein
MYVLRFCISLTLSLPETYNIATLIYTSLGRSFEWRGGVKFSVSPEDVAHMVQFLRKLPDLVASGVIRPNRVKLWEGGLGAINEGLEYMRGGKVRAEKLVYHVPA